MEIQIKVCQRDIVKLDLQIKAKIQVTSFIPYYRFSLPLPSAGRPTALFVQVRVV